ncbi:MAG: ribosome recycling factor [Acidimicrobiia bacterium]|nr:ribosome recycling factor [Acidimicrobiia bacterium]MBT8249169.1 ribosome recycling factor [Acidimicrobiia bacterium]NNC43825.1 ribosome recycling factor [Acidimicrobiia bacterium]NNL27341.1 ribosome recycling factor [Acidimicrobiia bacterium]
MIAEVLADAEAKMDKAIEHVQQEFSTVRTGRANPAILHRVMVEYYGTRTPLQQLATFSVPEPTTLVISPFDKGSISDIEKALESSSLGLQPNSDGNVIRLAFPPLTEDRRKELVKVVSGMAEDGRISIRNIRRPAKEDLEAFDGEMSDDEIRRGEKRLQELTDKFVARVDELFEQKQAELLEV